MDRRVKERLVGASILAVLIVLIVPELLSGPPPAVIAAKGRSSLPEPVRNITVDLATAKPLAPEPPDLSAASSAAPDSRITSAASATGGADAPASNADAEPLATAPPASRVETPAPAPRIDMAAPHPSAVARVPKTDSGSKPATAAGAWAVQLGSFANRANADKLMRRLKAQGFSVYVVSLGSGRSLRYRVRVGPLADRGAAAQAVARLKSLGHNASFVPPAA